MTAAVERSARELQKAGLTATAAVRDGDARSVLLEEAESWPADCIFVGAQGLTAVERFLMGSVSAAAASRAKCSVEVVRSPASST